MNKKYLGQYNTTNSIYILNGFEDKVKNKDVVDPFAGSCDLLNWANNNKAKSIIGYDIDKGLLSNIVSYNDSLKNLPACNFIITNPPYLAKNKMNQIQKKEYNIEDLYMLCIEKIIETNIQEGIIIIPINFFSAEKSKDIRNKFLSNYRVENVNYFREQVFNDTTYNVVSFYFQKCENENQKVCFTIFPENKTLSIFLEKKYDYSIAGNELYNLYNYKLRTINLIEQHITLNNGPNKIDCFFNDKKTNREYFVSDNLFNKINNNIILLNCIDSSKYRESWINAEDIRKYNKDCLVGKISSRNIVFILLDNYNIQQQELMIDRFNLYLTYLRDKYKSLFLTNFRDNDRKRISFQLCYNILAYSISADWKEI